YLLAVTAYNICHCVFITNQDEDIQNLKDEWFNATIRENDVKTLPFHRQIWEGYKKNQPIHLLLRGTPFQLQVWEALITIPTGTFFSYENIAQLSGKPTATRATASAIARNHIAWLIPC